MKASIIAIGDELLIGQVVDTNSNWLANQLTHLGIKIQSISLIADTRLAIKETLKRELKESDFVIFTGGLGPTKDDVTKESLAEFFDVGFKTDEDTLNRIKNWFEKHNRIMVQENLQQAEVPENCDVLPNFIGTAPGMWFSHKNQIIVSLPGVPYEMKELFTNEVSARLQKLLGTSQAIRHKTCIVSGIPESLLSKELEDFEASLPEGTQLSYLPNFQHIRLRLTDYKPDQNDLELCYKRLLEEVQSYLIAEGDKQIEVIIGDMLLEKGETVSFAESCTGGNIAQKMVSVPGSSRYFEGGIVAYSYDIKEHSLDIPKEILLKHGAVSKEVVELMATSVRKKMGTTYSLAVSGIAGPDGGMPNKPVGTVWISACGPDLLKSRVFHFRGDRQKVIQHTTSRALEYLRELVADNR